MTAALARSPLTEMTLPATLSDEINIQGPVKIPIQEGRRPDVRVKGNPIRLIVKLDAVAVLVDGDYIRALLQVSTGSDDPKPESAGANPIGSSYEELLAAFAAVEDGAFGTKGMNESAWVAVSKHLLAATISTTFNQAKICLVGRGDIPRQEFSEKVSFPNETSMDCTPTRNCTADRVCSYSPKHDTRSCRACLLRIRGHCVQRGNDPFCEAAKAAQNKAYEAAEAARKLDCERLKSQEKLQCEAEKSGEKAICETGKEALRRLARTGNFANLRGSVSGQGDVELCFNDMYISEDLGKVEINVGLDGRAELDTSLKFVPLDIVGHLACQVPWTDRRRFTAAVQQSSVPISSNVTLVEEDVTAKLRFDVAEINIPYRISPNPK